MIVMKKFMHGSRFLPKNFSDEAEAMLQQYKRQGVKLPMKNIIRNEEQLRGIRESAAINTALLDFLAEHIREGMPTSEIDHMVYAFTTDHGAIPADFLYEGYPKSVCTSINDVVCHGIPSPNEVLQSGDIVSVIVADYPEDGETTIPTELQYVEIISVTASTGYDANTGEAKGDEKELPSTVTFLVLPEQAKVLAELEQVAKLHLALVYRGTTDGARQFIEAQDALIEELYAEPEEDPIEEGEAADPTAEMPESEVTG